MPWFKPTDPGVGRPHARLETWVWTLIYAGLLSALVGLFLQRGGDVRGGWAILGGCAAAALGVLLIVVRARLPDDSRPAARPPQPGAPR